MIIFDLLLLLMIIVATIYCLVLNRRIKKLQNDNMEFINSVKALTDVMGKIESDINSLTSLSHFVSSALDNKITLSENVINKLESVHNLGNKLLENLSNRMLNINSEYTARTPVNDVLDDRATSYYNTLKRIKK